MIHILNNLTADYYLQLGLLEKSISDKEEPLTKGRNQAPGETLYLDIISFRDASIQVLLLDC
jgi:hypothetical protein